MARLVRDGLVGLVRPSAVREIARQVRADLEREGGGAFDAEGGAVDSGGGAVDAAS
jgi:hypothetical protein